MPPTRRRVLISGLAVFLLWPFSPWLFGQPQQSTPSPIPTIALSVQQVAVDVVAKDAAGNPVTGLKREDFRVTEDDKPQTLNGFEAYTADALAAQAAALHVTIPPLPPDTVSNVSAVTQTGPLTVVLFDLLNTPLEAQSDARAQLLEFLDKRPRTALVAIFVLTDGVHLLQGFTDDDKALKAALERQSNYRATELVAGSASLPNQSTTDTGLLAAQNPQFAQQLAQAQQQAQKPGNSRTQIIVNKFDPEAVVAELLLHGASLQGSAFLDRRVDLTTSALEDIAKFLSSLPGRKSLIWLSGSFPAGILPNVDIFNRPLGLANKVDVNLTASSAYEQVRNYSGQTREAANALNESHTAVYPVDVRGLQASDSYNASVGAVLLSPTQADAAIAAAGTQSRDTFAALNKQGAERLTMDTIAADTGGQAFYNRNSLADAANKAMEDGSTYYALTYQPTNTKTDGKLRQIKVVCLKHGYTLEYRRSYFADSAASKSSPRAAADPMLVALRRGAPPAHGLIFQAHLQAIGGPIPATPQELEDLSRFQPRDSKHPASPSEAKPVMLQHYAIAYGLPASQLSLTAGPDGQRHAALDLAAMVYDREGNLLKGLQSRIEDTIAPARYDRLQQNGYQTVQRIGVPINATTLRIGVRDVYTKLIGSTEVHLPLSSNQ